MSRKCSIGNDTSSVHDDQILLRDEIIQLQSRLLILRTDRLVIKLKRNDAGQWDVVKSDLNFMDTEEIQMITLKIADLKKKCYTK